MIQTLFILAFGLVLLGVLAVGLGGTVAEFLRDFGGLRYCYPPRDGAH